MKLSSLAYHRAKISRRVYMYSRRREVYRRSVYRITRQLRRDIQRLKEIDKRKRKIIFIRSKVSEFTGIRLKGRNMSREYDVKMAICLYFKYGIEHKITTIDLVEHIGRSSPHQANNYRRWFTKSFRVSKENKEIWDRFNEYIKNS